MRGLIYRIFFPRFSFVLLFQSALIVNKLNIRILQDCYWYQMQRRDCAGRDSHNCWYGIFGIWVFSNFLILPALQGVEKLIPSKMMLPGSNRRIHSVHRHSGMVPCNLRLTMPMHIVLHFCSFYFWIFVINTRRIHKQDAIGEMVWKLARIHGYWSMANETCRFWESVERDYSNWTTNGGWKKVNELNIVHLKAPALYNIWSPAFIGKYSYLRIDVRYLIHTLWGPLLLWGKYMNLTLASSYYAWPI